MTELTDEQINKRIHELMGLCQHKWNKAMYQNTWICSICGLHTDTLPVTMDFTTSWEGFGLIWEWLQKHERWEEFLNHYGYSWNYKQRLIDLNIISPPAMSKAVVEFFGETIPLPNLQGWGEEDGFTKEK